MSTSRDVKFAPLTKPEERPEDDIRSASDDRLKLLFATSAPSKLIVSLRVSQAGALSLESLLAHLDCIVRKLCEFPLLPVIHQVILWVVILIVLPFSLECVFVVCSPQVLASRLVQKDASHTHIAAPNLVRIIIAGVAVPGICGSLVSIISTFINKKCSDAASTAVYPLSFDPIGAGMESSLMEMGSWEFWMSDDEDDEFTCADAFGGVWWEIAFVIQPWRARGSSKSEVLRAILSSFVLSSICWLPFWMVFGHLIVSYNTCSPETLGSSEETLKRQLQCYLDLHSRAPMSSAVADLASNNIHTLYKYTGLEEHLHPFLVFTTMVGDVHQASMFEMIGSAIAGVISTMCITIVLIRKRTNRVVIRVKEAFRDSPMADVQFEGTSVDEALGLPNGITDDVSLKKYLSDLQNVSMWKGLHPGQSDRDIASVSRWSIAKAALVAGIHFLIPWLSRMCFSFTEVSTPSISVDPSLLIGFSLNNAASALVLFYIVFKSQMAFAYYSSAIQQLLILRAMWHLPTLQNVVNIYSSKPDEDQHMFLTYCWCFSLRDDDARRSLYAWWYLRQYLFIDFTDRRLSIEGLLILSLVYFLVWLLWAVFEIVRHAYGHSLLRPFACVALWDMIALGNLVIIGGLRLCVMMNQFLEDELLLLIEMRKGVYETPLSRRKTSDRIRRITKSQTRDELDFLRSSEFQQAPSEAGTEPGQGSVQVSDRLDVQTILKQIRLGNHLDAIIEHLRCSEMQQTLLGTPVNKALQMRVGGLIITTIFSVIIRTMIGQSQ